MRKIIGTLMSCIMILGLVSINVLAAGSIVANGSAVGYVLQYGKLVDGSYAVFSGMSEASAIENIPDTVQTQIESLNAGESIKKVIDTKDIAADVDLLTYALLTQVQDLKAYDNNGNQLEDNVTLTWEVPNLTKNNYCKVRVLHYSTKRKCWEVIKPDSVDLEKSTITVTFEDLSPVAVIYDTCAACDAANAESGFNKTTNSSTNTGVKNNLNTTFYAAVASAALLGIVILATHKKSTK